MNVVIVENEGVLDHLMVSLCADAIEIKCKVLKYNRIVIQDKAKSYFHCTQSVNNLSIREYLVNLVILVKVGIVFLNESSILILKTKTSLHFNFYGNFL
jgi:hypothetical protein